MSEREEELDFGTERERDGQREVEKGSERGRVRDQTH